MLICLLGKFGKNAISSEEVGCPFLSLENLANNHHSRRSSIGPLPSCLGSLSEEEEEDEEVAVCNALKARTNDRSCLL